MDALEHAIPGARSVFFEDMMHMPLTHADRFAEAMVEFTSQVDEKA
jgi:hypothetical protein